MKNANAIIGNLGQWVACCAISVGIFLEVLYRANIGYVAITGGSLLFAIFTKVKYYKAKPTK